jgi:hypothetical protein
MRPALKIKDGKSGKPLQCVYNIGKRGEKGTGADRTATYITGEIVPNFCDWNVANVLSYAVHKMKMQFSLVMMYTLPYFEVSNSLHLGRFQREK